MFCPECGTLGYVEPAGNITCNVKSCGYSGSATNIIYVHNGKVDVSQIKTSMTVEEPTRGHREFGDSMSPFWDEPGVRLQSTETRKCPKCNSTNLRIICNEEECVDCGAHAS